MEINNTMVEEFIEQIKFDYERGLISKELLDYNLKTLGVKHEGKS